MAGLNLRGNNATVETVQKQWQQLTRVRNLYLLSCARVPRIVLIIVNVYIIYIGLYQSFFYSFFISYLLFIILFIIYFIFMLCPQLASAKYIDT